MVRVDKGRVLQDWSDWAANFRGVELVLLLRHHVAVGGLTSLAPGRGDARAVMEELCAWANCAGVILELSPERGPDYHWLKKFFVSLGFVPNFEVPLNFAIKEDMIFYPTHELRHERCR